MKRNLTMLTAMVIVGLMCIGSVSPSISNIGMNPTPPGIGSAEGQANEGAANEGAICNLPNGDFKDWLMSTFGDDGPGMSFPSDFRFDPDSFDPSSPMSALNNSIFEQLHGIDAAWTMGYTGKDTNIAVVDTGVDFAHVDLQGTYATVDDLDSPYHGWPIAFDPNSMSKLVRQGTTEGTWYANTSRNGTGVFDIRHNIKVDGFNDFYRWLATDTRDKDAAAAGGDKADFDLTNISATRDETYWYFGFQTYPKRGAQETFGDYDSPSYGMYIDLDNGASGTATVDPKGNNIDTLSSHSNHVTDVKYSPDGTKLATSSKDLTVKIWDLGTGNCIRVFDDYNNIPWSIDWSKDGKYLATADRTVLTVWNAETGALVLRDDYINIDFTEIVGGEFYDAFTKTGTVSISSNSTWVAVSTRQNIYIYDMVKGTYFGKIRSTTANVNTIAFHPTQNLLAAGLQAIDGDYYPVYVYDLATVDYTGATQSVPYRQLKADGHEEQVVNLAWHPTNPDRLASVCKDIRSSLIVWDVVAGTQIAKRDAAQQMSSFLDVGWSHDGANIVTTERGTFVTSGNIAPSLVIRGDTGLPVTTVNRTFPINSVDCHPLIKEFAIGSNDRRATFYNFNGNELGLLIANKINYAVYFDSDFIFDAKENAYVPFMLNATFHKWIGTAWEEMSLNNITWPVTGEILIPSYSLATPNATFSQLSNFPGSSVVSYKVYKNGALWSEDKNYTVDLEKGLLSLDTAADIKAGDRLTADYVYRTPGMQAHAQLGETMFNEFAIPRFALGDPASLQLIFFSVSRDNKTHAQDTVPQDIGVFDMDYSGAEDKGLNLYKMMRILNETVVAEAFEGQTEASLFGGNYGPIVDYNFYSSVLKTWYNTTPELYKNYDFSKPASNTPMPKSQYTIDLATGNITFTPPLKAGDEIRANYSFDMTSNTIGRTTSLGNFARVEIGNYVVDGITSKSNNFHFGMHPSSFLNIKFGGLGILVVDSTTPGVYDTVYMDLNNDNVFDATDVMVNKANPVAWLDDFNATASKLGLGEEYRSTPDGFPDISAGMLYFISDGVTPIPYSERYSKIWSIEDGSNNKTPANGALICLMGEFIPGARHGTQVASRLVSQGRLDDYEVKGICPDAKIVPIGGPKGRSDVISSWYFAVEGYDGVVETGDEVQVVVNAFDYPSIYEAGWDDYSRMADYISIVHGNATTLFVMPSGDGGYGYGTITSPGAAPGVLTVGPATDYYFRSDQAGGTEGENYHYGDITSYASRGPTPQGLPKPDCVAISSGFVSLPLHLGTDGSSAYTKPLPWSGSDHSCALASGIAIQVYQAYYEQYGKYPSASVVKNLLMSGADDIGYDILSQGAGFLNARRSTMMAAKLGGLSVSHTFWAPGTYKGIAAEAFTPLMLPGQSVTDTIHISNHGNSPVNVEVSDFVFDKTGEFTYSTKPTDKIDYQTEMGAILGATLNVIYTAGAGYNGTHPLRWGLYGQPMVDTEIYPVAGDTWKSVSLDLFAHGVNSIEKVSMLQLEFNNTDLDDDLLGSVSFDLVSITVRYVTTNLDSGSGGITSFETAFDAVPKAKAQRDNATDALEDVQSQDSVGAPPNNPVPGDGWYTVGRDRVMHFDGFDMSPMGPSEQVIFGVELNVKYSVMDAYTGTNPIKWSLDDGNVTFHPNVDGHPSTIIPAGRSQEYTYPAKIDGQEYYTPHHAWYSFPGDYPPTQDQMNATHTEYNEIQYGSMSHSDNKRSNIPAGGAGTFKIDKYEINEITKATRFMSEIDIVWEGMYSETANGYIWVFNFADSQWETLGEEIAFASGSEQRVIRSITSNFANYVSDGRLMFLVAHNANSMTDVNFVRVRVTGTSEYNQVATYDLFAQGITSVWNLSRLNLFFFNNDNPGKGPDAVSFDYIWLTVKYRGLSGIQIEGIPNNYGVETVETVDLMCMSIGPFDSTGDILSDLQHDSKSFEDPAKRTVVHGDLQYTVDSGSQMHLGGSQFMHPYAFDIVVSTSDVDWYSPEQIVLWMNGTGLHKVDPARADITKKYDTSSYPMNLFPPGLNFAASYQNAPQTVVPATPGLWESADMVRITAYSDYTEFSNITSDGDFNHTYTLSLLDWGWDDSYHHSGITSTPVYFPCPNKAAFYGMNYPKNLNTIEQTVVTSNVLELRLSMPASKVGDGLVVHLAPLNEDFSIIGMDWHFKFEFFEKTDWEWLTVSNWLNTVTDTGSVPITVPVSGAHFTATVNVPADAGIGSYQGGIQIKNLDNGELTTIPVLINVASLSSNFEFGGTGPGYQDLYDNTMLLSGYDSTFRSGTQSKARPYTGDRRYYFFDIPNQGLYANAGDMNFRLLLEAEWNTKPSDIDLLLLSRKRAPDQPARVTPARYGSFTLENAGGSEEISGVEFYTTTNRSKEVVSPSITPGLNVLMLRGVILDGSETYESFNGRSSEVTMSSDAFVVTPNAAGTVPVSLTANVDLDGISASAVGPAVSESLEDIEIKQDYEAWWNFPNWGQWNMMGSFTYWVNLTDCLILEVHIVGHDDASDLDLAVFKDLNGDGELSLDEVQDVDCINYGGSNWIYDADADADEKITWVNPPDGPYIIKVIGFTTHGTISTGEQGGHFDMTISQTLDTGSGYEVLGTNETGIVVIEKGDTPDLDITSIPAYQTVSIDAFWNFPGTVKDGDYGGAVIIGTADAPGLVVIPMRVSLDREAPHIEDTMPLENFVTNNPRTAIFASFKDEVRGELKTAKLYLNRHDLTTFSTITIPFDAEAKGEGYVLGSISYQPQIPIEDGTHRIDLEVHDWAGNVAVHTWTFTVDTASPGVNMIYPTESLAHVNTPTITLLGSTEPDSVVSVVGAFADVEQKENGEFRATLQLVGGQNDVYLYSTDPSGNRMTVPLRLIYDNTHPTFRRVLALDGSNTNKRTTGIYGEMSERGTLLLNGMSVPVNSDGTFRYEPIHLIEGQNMQVLEFRDLAGNVAYNYMNITLDTAAPVMALANIEKTVYSETLNITGSTEADIASLTINGKLVTVDASGNFQQNIRLSPGTNTIVVESKDRADNSAQEVLIVNYVADHGAKNWAVIGLLLALIAVGLFLGLLMGPMIMPGSGTLPVDAVPEEELPSEVQTQEVEDIMPEETVEPGLEPIPAEESMPEETVEPGLEPIPAEESMPEELPAEPEPEAAMPEDPRIAKLRQAYESGKISKELYEKNLARFKGQ